MEFDGFDSLDELDEQYLQPIIEYVTTELDLQVLESTRYRYIQFRFNENIYEAEVGEVFELNNEHVLAILEGGLQYYICTEHTGVPDSGDQPLMIPKGGRESDILQLERFDT